MAGHVIAASTSQDNAAAQVQAALQGYVLEALGEVVSPVLAAAVLALPREAVSAFSYCCGSS